MIELTSPPHNLVSINLNNLHHAYRYGDYNTLCPAQTFDEQTLLKNFPNSDRQPWVVVNTFGPTASGAQGYTAIVPEMNKVSASLFEGQSTLTVYSCFPFSPVPPIRP